MLSKHIILHLTLIDGVGPGSIWKIMERSDMQISDLYLLSLFDWMNVFDLSEKTASKIFVGLSDKKILEQELYLIEKNNIQWITIADESYPSLLKEIHLPPAVLYYQGKENFSDKSIVKRLSIVGSRKATVYGQRAINAIVPDLVAAGYTIVSGGALGIDTMAHKAALACGGKTIAVLGSGLLRPYPNANKKLFAEIIERGGSIVSSYPLTTEPFPGNFPARNRIITGLSRGCLVVQAAQKSGALISAHCALEQGRDVFAVPGLFDDALSAGCHEIIQQGAKLTVSSSDILSEFGDKVTCMDKQENILQRELFVPVSASTLGIPCEVSHNMGLRQKIIAACRQPISYDDIIIATQLSSEVVQDELLNLQFEGIIEQDFTGIFLHVGK